MTALRPQDLQANPHRDFALHPLDQAQVERLKASIDADGFWASVVARKKDQENGISIGGAKPLLLRTELFDVLRQYSPVLLFGFVYGVYDRCPLLEIDIIAFPHPKIFWIYFHLCPFGTICHYMMLRRR